MLTDKDYVLNYSEIYYSINTPSAWLKHFSINTMTDCHGNACMFLSVSLSTMSFIDIVGNDILTITYILKRIFKSCKKRVITLQYTPSSIINNTIITHNYS